MARKRYQPLKGALFKGLIEREEYRKHDVNFSFICANGGSPLFVAKRADVAYAGSFERFAAFDYDGKHEEFIGALDFCTEPRMAGQRLMFSLRMIREGGTCIPY